MRKRAATIIVGLLASVAVAERSADDWSRWQPGEASILKVLARLRQMKPDDRAYVYWTTGLDRLSRPQDVPTLLRELPNGPTEPLIDMIAQQWKSDRPTQIARSTDPSPAVRRAALRAFGWGAAPTTADLSVVADRVIKDADADVRREAASAVANYGGVAFAKLLADRLGKTPPARLAEVVRLMAEHGDPARDARLATAPAAGDAVAVAKTLERLMRSPDAAVRAAAVSHPPPNKTDWPTLAAAELAGDPDAGVRLSLAKTLRPNFAGATPTGLRLLDDADAAVRGEALEAVMFAPTVHTAVLVAKVAERVNDPDPYVRGRLKIVLDFRKSPAVTPAFRKALAGDRGPRLAALEAMALDVPPAIGPAIEKLLDDADPITRARAYAAAGHLPLDERLAMRFAHAALTDRDPAVRHAASQSMAGMIRGAMVLIFPPPNVDRAPTIRLPDLKITPASAAADPQAAALLQAYAEHGDPDRVLDLLAGEDAAAVDAATALLQDLADRESLLIKPIIARAAVRGGRAAALVGMIVPWATRGKTGGINAPPDGANALTRAIRAAAGGAGRDAALARLALHESPAAASAAGESLIHDAVPAVRATAVTAAIGVPTADLPPSVLAALDDADPAVAARAASCVVGLLYNTRRDQPPFDAPQPAAARLAAADATVRAAAVTALADAAAGRPVLLDRWPTLMADPDPAVRKAVADALRRIYAGRSPPGR